MIYDDTLDLAKELTSSAADFLAKDVSDVARLECFARTFCGIGCVMPKSLVATCFDFIGSLSQYGNNKQILVEVAYMCFGFIRWPEHWSNLGVSRRNIFLSWIRLAKSIVPPNNNWMLFGAMINLFEVRFRGKKDKQLIATVLALAETWYLGDGIYADGASKLQLDYYNSYCIHPFIFALVYELKRDFDFGYDVYFKRAIRYAEVLENMISPEGTFPIMGRSSTYRFAAFAHLSDMLRRDMISTDFAQGAIHGMHKVVMRMRKNLFDENGTVQVGCIGKQAIGEYYISQGSAYMCCMGLSHIARPKEDVIWGVTNPDWTQKKIWRGDDIKIAKSLPSFI